MASVITDGKTRAIQFIASDGRRPIVRLGKCDQRTAEGVKRHVENLLISRENAMPLHPDTVAWLRSIGEKLYDRLAASGLCDPRLHRRGVFTLKKMLDAYIERRKKDMKPWSVKMLQQARNKLLAFFGDDRVVETITAADAHDFRRTLAADGASVAYVAKVTLLSRQFFGDAVGRELIPKNPFVGIKVGSQKNPERQRFIPREVIDRVIDHAGAIEWKLLIALARYGGLRIPTEAIALKWTDINWDAGKITVPSPKTERHPGKAYRTIPLFPELKGLLMEAFEQAPEGAVYVLPRFRNPAQNFRTQFTKLLTHLGIDPWPRLFQNLRSTRQTELAENWPSHVVCAWMGNTERIALGHYLQTTEDHFRKAAGLPEKKPLSKNGAVGGMGQGRGQGAAKALQHLQE
ncbi:MAG: site-specific integrase [Tepidisphaeraceae bacterium]